MIKNGVKKIFKHPYFPFIVAGVILIALQILDMFALTIPVSIMRGIGKIMIYSIAGLGFSLLLGYSGLASLGTAGFIGVGAYVMGWLFTLNFPITLIIALAILVGLVIGIFVGSISLRVEGMYLAIVTLIIASLLAELFANIPGFGGMTGLTIELSILGVALTRKHVFIFIVFAMVILIIVITNIIRSHIGRALLAIKNSPSAAQAMGISVFKYRMMSFIIATIFSVIAGVLYMMSYETTEPTSWSLMLSLNILAAVIVGGSKSVYGIILGCFFMFGLDVLVYSNIPFLVNNPDLPGILNGILIILVIMFYPDGLAGLIRLLYFKIRMILIRRKERKYGPETSENQFELFEKAH